MLVCWHQEKCKNKKHYSAVQDATRCRWCVRLCFTQQGWSYEVTPVMAPRLSSLRLASFSTSWYTALCRWEKFTHLMCDLANTPAAHAPKATAPHNA